MSIRTAQYWSETIRFKTFTSHALRKLCRTIIADMGVDTMVGERILNHALPLLLRTYVNSTLDKGMLMALDAYHAHLITLGFDDVAPEIMRQSTTEPHEPVVMTISITNSTTGLWTSRRRIYG